MTNATVQVNHFNSSALQSGQYDPVSRLLSLTFRGGRTYTYTNIVPEAWEGLVTSESAGEYFNFFIRGCNG